MTPGSASRGPRVARSRLLAAHLARAVRSGAGELASALTTSDLASVASDLPAGADLPTLPSNLPAVASVASDLPVLVGADSLAVASVASELPAVLVGADLPAVASAASDL